MSHESFLRAAAASLLDAYRSGRPVDPLSRAEPELTIADAYEIQSMQVESWAAEGRAVLGYKVGLTSEAMRTQLGVDRPDFGVLVDGMIEPSGSVVATSAFISPRVEPEISVVLGQELRGPGLAEVDVERAIERVVGTLEIIDSRIADWRITIVDTIADNASSGGVVVGDLTLPLRDIDLVAERVVLKRNGEIVGEGTGAAVLGTPVAAVTWLANTLGEYGVALPAGSLVMPGSVCAAVPVAAGDRITAEFGVLGTVEVSFAGGSDHEKGN